MQLVETNISPAHGKDEALNRPGDLGTSPGRPVDVSSGHSKFREQLATDKVSARQEIGGDEDQPIFWDCVVSIQRCSDVERMNDDAFEH